MKMRKWHKVLVGLLGVVVILSIAGLAYIPYMQMRRFVDMHVDFKEVYNASDWNLEASPLSLTTEDGLKLAAWQVDAQRRARRSSFYRASTTRR